MVISGKSVNLDRLRRLKRLLKHKSVKQVRATVIYHDNFEDKLILGNFSYFTYKHGGGF